MTTSTHPDTDAVNSNSTETKSQKVPFYKNPYLIAFVAGAAVLTFIRPYLRRVPKPPAVIGLAPTFQLTNQEGLPFGSAELKGSTYVASFVFTSCQTVCPLITQGLVELQERYERNNIPVKLVTFSVDPLTDTPDVLKTYAEKLKADTGRWQFLTGAPTDVAAALKGFHFSLESKIWTNNAFYEIAHTQKLVLVDGKGGVRGYYGSDKQGIDEVFHRSQHVLRSETEAQ